MQQETLGTLKNPRSQATGRIKQASGAVMRRRSGLTCCSFRLGAQQDVAAGMLFFVPFLLHSASDFRDQGSGLPSAHMPARAL